MLQENRNTLEPVILTVYKSSLKRNYAQIAILQQVFEREQIITCNEKLNFCVSLLRKTKRGYSANLETIGNFGKL